MDNFMRAISDITDRARAASFKNSPQITLGEFIKQFESIPLVWGKDDEDKTIEFDFGTAVPTKLNSWRGSYSELALGYVLTGYDNNENHMGEALAKDILAELKGAIGKEYTGWKGGDYIMDEDTPVWVANAGNSGNTAVVGVLDAGYKIVILTSYCEY